MTRFLHRFAVPLELLHGLLVGNGRLVESDFSQLDGFFLASGQRLHGVRGILITSWLTFGDGESFACRFWRELCHRQTWEQGRECLSSSRRRLDLVDGE